MKNQKMRVLCLGILSTVVISSTPVFAATNSVATKTPTKFVQAHKLASVTKVSDSVAANSTAIQTPTISRATMHPSFNYGPDGGPYAETIIENGGIIQRGDVGIAVKNVQALLHSNYNYDYVSVDGIFGADTERAVKDFQSRYGLEQDGKVGSKTWYYLL